MATENGNQGPSAQAPVLVGVLQVKVSGGDTERMFYLSKALLSKYAPRFLSKILEKQENETLVIEDVDGVKIRLFQFLMLWLRWLDINEGIGGSPLNGPLPWLQPFGNDPVNNIWYLVVEILSFYDFGLKYSIRGFCEAMVDYLSHHVNESASIPQSVGQEEQIRAAIKTVQHRYSITTGPCQLRCILVDIFYATKLDKSLSRADLRELPKEFLEDITLRRVTLAGHKECASGARESLKRQPPEDEEASRKKQKVNFSDEDAVLDEAVDETKLAAEDTEE